MFPKIVGEMAVCAGWIFEATGIEDVQDPDADRVKTIYEDCTNSEHANERYER